MKVKKKCPHCGQPVSRVKLKRFLRSKRDPSRRRKLKALLRRKS